MQEKAQANPSALYHLIRLLIVPSLLLYGPFAYHALFSPDGETVVYAWWARLISVFVTAPVIFGLGFLIMRRAPGNLIGPALIVFAATGQGEIIFALQHSAVQAQLNLLSISVVTIPLFIVIMAHFPDGRVYSRWMSPFVYLMVIIIVVVGTIGFFASPDSYGTEFAYGEPSANPFLIEALDLREIDFLAVGSSLSVLVVVGAIGLLIYRYFKTSGIERKQIRWFGFGLLVAMLVSSAPQVLVNLEGNEEEWVLFTTSLGIVVFDATVPLAIGIGILFYRLWDIDVIIRRTFTYAILSALLVGTYLLVVLIFQSVLDDIIASDSSAVIVISTLTVAILFNPLRHRVQQVIDRVFYRKRYDANLTLEAFSDQIRHATQSEAIQQHLIQSISSTIQPATISFWEIERRS